MKQKIRMIGIMSLVLAGLISIFANSRNLHAGQQASDVIYDGIYLGNVAVGGMTEQEARTAFEQYLNDLRDMTLRFSLEESVCEISMSELSVAADIDQAVKAALSYGRSGNILERYREIADISNDNVILPIDITYDETPLIERLEEGFSDYIIPAKEASLTMSGGSLSVVPGENGRELDTEATTALVRQVVDNWDGDPAIALNVVTNELLPQHSTEELSQVTDVIGSFETTFSASDASRNNNIANAANKISNVTVYPGEEFDTMAHLVPFTEANGWSYAGAYLNGEVISDIGGGICQVSTTLYNAVLRAELEIVERHSHSMAVGYVQLSADAALNEGTKNFRFRNNMDTPIYVYAYAGSGVMHVTIYGKETRAENRTVQYKNEILEVIDPGEPIETVDETLPSDYREVKQSAHTGYQAKLWKYVYINGELQDTILVNSSYYAASPQRVTVGKPSDSPEEAVEPQEPTDPDVPVISTEAPVSTEVPVSTETPATTEQNMTEAPEPVQTTEAPEQIQTQSAGEENVIE